MACASTSAPPTEVDVLQGKVYQFRIELCRISLPIWRRIQVPSDYCFFALHSAIQDFMGWDGFYLYRFISFSRKPEVDSVRLPLDDEVPCYERDRLITDYFTSGGDTASYVYRDEWLFRVLLEDIVDRSVGVSYPVCLDGRRRCVLEDKCNSSEYQFYLDVAFDEDVSKRPYFAEVLKSMGHSEDFNPQSVVFKNPKERFKLASELFLY